MKKYSAPRRAFTFALFGISVGSLTACGAASDNGAPAEENTGETTTTDRVTEDPAVGRMPIQTPPALRALDDTCSASGETRCDGAQPMICDGNAWQTNGGACAYGCSAGACACSAPSGRLTPQTCNQCTLVEDSATGLRWYHNDGDWGPAAWDRAGEMCSWVQGRLPTVAEVMGILAEQAPAEHCAPNHDPLLPSTNLWTQDAAPSGHVVVSTIDGTTTEAADTAFKSVWCLIP